MVDTLTRRQRTLCSLLASDTKDIYICEPNDGSPYLQHYGESKTLRPSTLAALHAAGMLRAVGDAWVASKKCLQATGD